MQPAGINAQPDSTYSMLKHPALTAQRVRQLLDKIEPLIHSPRVPLELAAWRVGGEPAPPETAFAAEYAPFYVGETWGARWDTTWFRLRGAVPAEWRGREVAALMRPSDTEVAEGFTAEGLIYVGGVPVRALNVHRSEIEITPHARGGEEFEVFVEAAANGGASSAGAVSGDLLLPNPHGPHCFRLAQAELACIDRAVFDFYFDFKVAVEAVDCLPENSQRRGELLYALNNAANCFDENDPASIAPAREALRDVLSKRNGDTVHTLSAIGHAHMDTAWLWPLRETIRKCARTFSTALDYMSRYPEYVFGCSQAQQYAWMKTHYPTVYQGIREAVRRGQWEPIGSMWVEPDCNLSSGESLVRQILWGKRFFAEEFGVETTDVWIPDVFGYCASMPQIMRQCGVDSFMTHKISWNQFNKFPHQTFLWEGIDGSQIFTHFPPADTYNAKIDAKTLLKNINNFKEHDRASRSLLIYGYGDGGGGPSITMLEQARRLGDFNGLPKVQPEKVSTFFAKAKADARDLPVWVGELYLELHRGTYTSQARNKRGNRKAEFLLRDAEFADVISRWIVPHRQERAANPDRAVYDVTGLDGADAGTHRAALERAWKLVLLNQFHDIIPGSSIHWVYLDSAKDYETIEALGRSVLASSFEALQGAVNTAGFREPVLVVNTLSFAREETLELPGGALTRVAVPACGYTVVDAEAASGAPAQPARVSQTGAGTILENGLLRLHFDAAAHLTRVEDIAAGREVLAEGAIGNALQLHRDVPVAWDAWDVDVFYKETGDLIEGLEVIEVAERGPLRASVRIVRSFGGSRIEQRIVLCAGSPRIDFVTEIDWRERQKMLKVAFPVNVRSAQATYEIQYGHVQRPTHYNTSWDLARFEVCAQKWADLSENDYGVALLNDCKYGYDIYGSVMRLSLLRAPIAPDPQADQGRHVFTYSLLPHAGSLTSAGVIEQAYALNVPLLTFPLAASGGSAPAAQSFFSVDRAGVFIESIKVAEDGVGAIVRFYEGYGSRGPVCVTTTLPIVAVEMTDLLERTVAPLDCTVGAVRFDIKPFEIVTLRFS